MLAVSEALILGLLSLIGVLATTLLTAVIGPLVVARFARRREPPAAVERLNEVYRKDHRHRALCIAAVQWLVTENAAVRQAAGLPDSEPPPLVAMLLADLDEFET